MITTRPSMLTEAKAVQQYALELRKILVESNFQFSEIQHTITTRNLLHRYLKDVPPRTVNKESFPESISSQTNIDPITYFIHDSQIVLPDLIRFFLMKKNIHDDDFRSHVIKSYKTLGHITMRASDALLSHFEATDSTRPLTNLKPEDLFEPQLSRKQIEESVHTFELMLQTLRTVQTGVSISKETARKCLNAKMHFEADQMADYHVLKQVKHAILELAAHKNSHHDTQLMIITLEELIADYKKQAAHTYNKLSRQIMTLLQEALIQMHDLCDAALKEYAASWNLQENAAKIHYKTSQFQHLLSLSKNLTLQNLPDFNTLICTLINNYITQHQTGLFGIKKEFTLADFHQLEPSYSYAFHLRTLQARTNILMSYHIILEKIAREQVQFSDLLTLMTHDHQEEITRLRRYAKASVNDSFVVLLYKLMNATKAICRFIGDKPNVQKTTAKEEKKDNAHEKMHSPSCRTP